MSGVRHGPSLVLVAILTFLGGCGGADDAGKRPLSEMGQGGTGVASDPLPPGMTASAAARLDSGNVAFRSRQYEAATRYYRAAANDVPEHPAPWYGIYMVGQATGNRELSDSAMRAVAARSGGSELLDTGNVKVHKTPAPPN